MLPLVDEKAAQTLRIVLLTRRIAALRYAVVLTLKQKVVRGFAIMRRAYIANLRKNRPQMNRNIPPRRFVHINICVMGKW